MSEVTEEQWHVQVEAGDVRLWTLDQLDAAFKAEVVDESTFVLEVGKTEWMQLGTLLGGGGDDGEPEAAPEPAHVYSREAIAPAAFAASAIPTARQGSPIAPVIISPTITQAPPSMGPYSTAPVAADIDDDFESPSSFRGSRKKPIAIGIGVALLAAGVAVFASSRGLFSAALPAPEIAAAAVAAPPPAPPPPAPTPAADPQPAAAQNTSLSARLTQDQLQKLADADKVHNAKMLAQQKARAEAAPHHSGGGHKSKEKSPFHSGGDKYDPLNAKL
jgi:hypothetical protein